MCLIQQKQNPCTNITNLAIFFSVPKRLHDGRTGFLKLLFFSINTKNLSLFELGKISWYNFWSWVYGIVNNLINLLNSLFREKNWKYAYGLFGSLHLFIKKNIYLDLCLNTYAIYTLRENCLKPACLLSQLWG